MDILIDLILIQFIIVNITDMSGFVEVLEHNIARYIDAKTVHIKILECSYCQNWWIGLTYLVIMNELTLPHIALVLALSLLTNTTKDILTLIIDMINKVIIQIYTKLNL